MSDLPPGQPDENKMNSRRDWKRSRHLEVYRLRGSNPGQQGGREEKEEKILWPISCCPPSWFADIGWKTKKKKEKKDCNGCLVMPDEVAGEKSPRMSECVRESESV